MLKDQKNIKIIPYDILYNFYILNKIKMLFCYFMRKYTKKYEKQRPIGAI